MNRSIGSITLVVADYDQAIAYYTQCLGFSLLEDIDQGGGKRWVRVAPSADAQTALLLAQAASDPQRERIGDQTGGRVGFFLHTDDFDRDHARIARTRGPLPGEAARRDLRHGRRFRRPVR